jgi:cytoskeletal protein CcmA (bactofilin family)
VALRSSAQVEGEITHEMLSIAEGANFDGRVRRAREPQELAVELGTGWVWAPDHEILDRVAFPRIKTLDTSSTPTGDERRFEPPLPTP